MKQLRADLEKAIDDAQERGLSVDQVKRVAIKRFIEFTIFERQATLDMYARFASVLFCLIVPAAIYTAKTHAAWRGLQMPQDDLLNWTCLVCLLAVTANTAPHLMSLIQLLVKLFRGDKT